MTNNTIQTKRLFLCAMALLGCSAVAPLPTARAQQETPNITIPNQPTTTPPLTQPESQPEIAPITLPGLPDADAQPPVASVAYDFATPQTPSLFAFTAQGDGMRKGSDPRIEDGTLALLDPWWKFVTSAAFAAPTTEFVRTVDISFTLTMSKGTEGMGFAWLDVATHGQTGQSPQPDAWEAPNLEHSFGIGFDAKDPANYDMFRGSGNIYDRPQHEISLHWNGQEIVKKVSPIEFRDEEPHAVHATIRFVTGGSEVSLSIDDTPVFENYFVPSMIAFVGRPAFGARNTQTAGLVVLDDLRIDCVDTILPPDEPLTLIAVDHKINDSAHPTNAANIEFPADLSPYGRIICTLTLDKPETRFDPWDRSAFIYVYDDDGTRYELLRYITPYHKGHSWKVDISDFRPLLTGMKKIEQVCSTQGEGWVVTVQFDLYPGPADRYAVQVVKLWEGQCVIGDPAKPTADFYMPRKVPIGKGVDAAAVRMVVTGHGMSPNTDNAGEFMPLGRTLTVSAGEQSKSWKNTLWKEDNYLNPCRPQGGTWKFDRAGWGPGDVVWPWKVDVSELLPHAATSQSHALTISYVLDDYINENRGKTWSPFHLTEGHLILYRTP